jgi:hypothetical protein
VPDVIDFIFIAFTPLPDPKTQFRG